ncbi:MAG: RDD family protein [Pseudomonadota bacterium]|nr:RDD family protein [Pseudomonadota bacterium]
MNDSVSSELRMQRLAATGLDWSLITVVTLLVILATGVLEHAEDYANVGQSAVNAVLCGLPAYLILNGWLLWTRGQTAGKAAMSLMIVDHQTGNCASLWKLLFVRALIPVVVIAVGFIWELLWLLVLIDFCFIFRKDQRCLHDWIAGTRVVKRDTGQ